ncbi:MAG: hypothetical protein RLN76_07260 [Phycisphaeraceae bacterium]
MSEWSPVDSELLGQVEDEATGVPYLETGLSPYYLQFRRMIERLARVAERSNDLRVYQDGDLTVGVRGGRCRVHGLRFEFVTTSSLVVTDEATTSVWIDDAGSLQSGASGFPAEAHLHLRLAEVDASGGAITEVRDLRGETFLAGLDIADLGLTATAAEIDRVLAGTSVDVTSGALGLLCGGTTSPGDNLHTHGQSLASVDGETAFTVRNVSTGASAGAAIGWSVPEHLASATLLRVLPDDGWLEQQVGGKIYGVVGGVPMQLVLPGVFTTSVNDRLIGVAPSDGVVDSVVLIAGTNLETSSGVDAVRASLKINDLLATDLPASLYVSDGSGYRSTDRGNGEAASLFSGSPSQVERGDLLTVTVTRSVSGVVTQEAEDVAVLVVLRSSKAI